MKPESIIIILAFLFGCNATETLKFEPRRQCEKVYEPGKPLSSVLSEDQIETVINTSMYYMPEEIPALMFSSRAFSKNIIELKPFQYYLATKYNAPEILTINYHPHLLRLEGIDFLKPQKNLASRPFHVNDLFTYETLPAESALFAWYHIAKNHRTQPVHVLGRLYKFAYEQGLRDCFSNEASAYLLDLPSIFTKLFIKDRQSFFKKLFSIEVCWSKETVKAFLLASGTELIPNMLPNSVFSFLENLNEILFTESSKDFDALVRSKIIPHIIDMSQSSAHAGPVLLLLIRYYPKYRVSMYCESLLHSNVAHRDFGHDFTYKMARVMVSVGKYEEAIPYYARAKELGYFNNHPEDELFFTQNRLFMLKIQVNGCCVIS